MGDDGAKLDGAGDRPRWVRNASVPVRAAHLLAACAVAGPYLVGAPAAGAHAWWVAAAASGALLLAAEYVAHPELHREVAGWATISKLVLVGFVPVMPSGAPWLLSAAVVVAALGAHFPRAWRHRRLFGPRSARG